MTKIFEEIAAERERQNEKWGEQNHPMLASELGNYQKLATNKVKRYMELNDDKKTLCWFTILMEEVSEVFAETDPIKQRDEMVQVAAVVVQIVEYLDRQIKGGK